MSSFLIGAGRTYSLDLDFIKSPSSSSRASHASSPSSTLSESSNCPLAISTRKPRTPRKRPNQTYNEAAALLSTAYPNIFPAKNLTKQHKFTSPQDSFFDEASELLFPFRVTDNDYSGFLLQNHIQEKPNFRIEHSKIGNSCRGEVNSGVSSANFCSELDEDFDAESILDEEIEEGIDSIMGNLSVESDKLNASWDGNPIGLGFGGKIEFPLRGVRAWRHSDEGNWWNSPTVNVHLISPKIATPNSNNHKKVEKKKKKKKVVEIKDPEVPRGNPSPHPKLKPKPKNGLLLKLNYDEVLNAWSDRGCPFDDADVHGSDVSARLAEINLLCENGGGVREASVLRYKKKRRTRLFSKKIRYQVRKVNADTRPRMKEIWQEMRQEQEGIGGLISEGSKR